MNDQYVVTDDLSTTVEANHQNKKSPDYSTSHTNLASHRINQTCGIYTFIESTIVRARQISLSSMMDS